MTINAVDMMLSTLVNDVFSSQPLLAKPTVFYNNKFNICYLFKKIGLIGYTSIILFKIVLTFAECFFSVIGFLFCIA